MWKCRLYLEIPLYPFTYYVATTTSWLRCYVIKNHFVVGYFTLQVFALLLLLLLKEIFRTHLSPHVNHLMNVINDFNIFDFDYVFDFRHAGGVKSWQQLHIKLKREDRKQQKLKENGRKNSEKKKGKS